MNTNIKTLLVAAVSGVLFSAQAGMHLQPSNNHFGCGVGMAVSEIPFALSKTKVPLSYFYYDRQFTDPTSMIRASLELGMYGFSLLVPVPEVGSNLYFGSEESVVQGKIGVGGFYDVAVAGHAGVIVKAGIIMKNRFGFDLFVVPTGSDAKRSYNEALGFESKNQAEANRLENGGHYVITPYFGFMITFRK